MKPSTKGISIKFQSEIFNLATMNTAGDKNLSNMMRFVSQVNSKNNNNKHQEYNKTHKRSTSTQTYISEMSQTNFINTLQSSLSTEPRQQSTSFHQFPDLQEFRKLSNSKGIKISKSTSETNTQEWFKVTRSPQVKTIQSQNQGHIKIKMQIEPWPSPSLSNYKINNKNKSKRESMNNMLLQNQINFQSIESKAFTKELIITIATLLPKFSVLMSDYLQKAMIS